MQQLSDDLASSAATQEALTDSLVEYVTIRQNLEYEIDLLSNTAGDLNSTVQELNEAIQEFESENQRFRLIVSFLEDEANGVKESYDDLANALAETILRKNALVQIGVEERMKAELAGWECGLPIAFVMHQFAQNFNLPIGYIYYDDVMGYVDDKLLSDFCIDTENFESYLENEIVPQGKSLWTLNLSDFTRGVNLYTWEVHSFYFPDGAEDGVNSTAWVEAYFECNNLSKEDRYIYI